jgi:hypothetical protein
VSLCDETRTPEIREKSYSREREEHSEKSPSNPGRKVLPATTKKMLINIYEIDGHTHNLICDNLIVDTITGMNFTPASTSRRQPSRSNIGVNTMASSKERSSNRSGRD